MANYLTRDLIIHLIIFQMVVLLIILSNKRITRRARRHLSPPVFPPVSILVPARNEERNIAGCVQSLLAQDYPSFEVLVLDDQSTDQTRFILDQIAASQPGLRVLEGEPLSGDRVGKNWACSQLAQQAGGELFFFTDADTRHHPQTLRTMVTALAGEQADLLTGFPRQEVHTWGERLLVPFFTWAFYCFCPLALAYRLQLPALSMAVGQMMLFRRQAYQSIGGHGSVSSAIAEDLVLARQIKASGLRWRVSYAADLISCRMYRDSREAMQGFIKNLFAAFDFRVLPFVFVFAWLAVMFLIPLVVLGMVVFGQAPGTQVTYLLICIGLSVLLWLAAYLEMGVPFSLAFLYPLTILAIDAAALLSLWKCFTGSLSWKGRKITQKRWRWL